MTVKTDNSTIQLRKRFGSKLKDLREETGMTQLEFAVHLDYGYPMMVSQVERGVSVLPEHDLRMWATLLRLDPAKMAQEYLYYCKPFVYECLYGKDPYAAEKLPRSAKTISPAPKRVSKRPSK